MRDDKDKLPSMHEMSGIGKPDSYVMKQTKKAKEAKANGTATTLADVGRDVKNFFVPGSARQAGEQFGSGLKDLGDVLTYYPRKMLGAGNQINQVAGEFLSGVPAGAEGNFTQTPVETATGTESLKNTPPILRQDQDPANPENPEANSKPDTEVLDAGGAKVYRDGNSYTNAPDTLKNVPAGTPERTLEGLNSVSSTFFTGPKDAEGRPIATGEAGEQLQQARLAAVDRGDFTAVDRSYMTPEEKREAELRNKAYRDNPSATYAAELGAEAAENTAATKAYNQGLRDVQTQRETANKAALDFEKAVMKQLESSMINSDPRGRQLLSALIERARNSGSLGNRSPLVFANDVMALYEEMSKEGNEGKSIDELIGDTGPQKSTDDQMGEFLSAI